MYLKTQWQEGLLRAPFTLLQLKQRSALALIAYLVTAFVVFGCVALVLVHNEQALFQAVLDYLFPQNWHWSIEKLVDHFFENQAKIVLSSMILSGSLVAASILLFPLKEYVSAAFERDAGYQNGPAEEFSLLHQGLEEAKLLLLYVTMQMVIVWIGYYPYGFTQLLSAILSIAFLFFTFGLDLIAPTLQRHKLSYALILKVLCRNPLLTFSFGMLYTLPVLALGQLVLANKTLSLIEMASILFMVNIVFLTLAIPAGTRIASQLMAEARGTQVPGVPAQTGFYAVLGITFAVFAFLHSQFMLSLHHKSQILKCEYDIDWHSFDIGLPSLSSLLSAKPKTVLSFDLEIKNPTEYDVQIEASQLRIEKDQQSIAVIQLNEIAVASGETIRKKVAFDTLIDIDAFKDFKGSDIQQWLRNWKITLHYEIDPGIPMEVNVLKTP